MKNLAKRVILVVLAALFSTYAEAQIKIHSHNDYAKPRPFYGALENKAFSIEADVFPVNGHLLVGHDKEDLKSDKTLEAMYINPILKQFASHKGYVSKDTAYSFSLMVEFKDNPDSCFILLTKLLAPYRQYFDRSLNARAIQIIITGKQGLVDNWKNYPDYIYFDGNPDVVYDGSALKRVAFFSDNYGKYFNKNSPPDTARFFRTISKVHSMGKYIRFWGSPDDPESWKKLIAEHIDILNTDHIALCEKLAAERKL